MEWINGLFTTHSALQTMVLLSLIIATGLALGKLHVKGISLGVCLLYFFVGIVAGHFQLSADKSMLDFCRDISDLPCFVLYTWTLRRAQLSSDCCATRA